jgi:hypothetical protein
MVRTVDDLEARGLALRRPSPADRRAYAVELTDEGRALFAEASRISDEVGARLLDCMEEQDRDLLCALLERFVTAAGQLVPRQVTFAPSRRPARTLGAPDESPRTSSTRTSARHTESTHRTPLLNGQTLPVAALGP